MKWNLMAGNYKQQYTHEMHTMRTAFAASSTV